ncbi:MAG TPA: twin-arginine translocase TatA/TatE family subunit [Kiritimatiellae bacterium]|nr:twin-arginine translocase TatA/TatE family subunit [Kiritimatiellia bacterium]
MEATVVGIVGGSVGGGELLLVLVFVLLLFGAERLPGFARWLGRVSVELRKAAREIWMSLTESDDAARPHGVVSKPRRDTDAEDEDANPVE